MANPLIVVDGLDWTPYITVPSYAVKLEPDYEEWFDGNHKKRRNVIRWKIIGKFTVKCPDSSTYIGLLQSLRNAAVDAGGYYMIDSVYINDSREVIENVEAYLDLGNLQNEEPILGTADSEGFEIELEER